ncbi:MAG: hypothetical protein ACK559_26425 [bacterium]
MICSAAAGSSGSAACGARPSLSRLPSMPFHQKESAKAAVAAAPTGRPAVAGSTLAVSLKTGCPPSFRSVASPPGRCRP